MGYNLGSVEGFPLSIGSQPVHVDLSTGAHKVQPDSLEIEEHHSGSCNPTSAQPTSTYKLTNKNTASMSSH